MYNTTLPPAYPIDAVITWVDGEDPKHKKKLQLFLSKDQSYMNSINDRYIQTNEIEYCVNSIIKYAKFIRKIFIVTDNQVPKFLANSQEKAKYPMVEIVDHSEIFKGYENHLPTFNSMSIESLLYKIPNLSEHFIYFNDDFFLFNETKVSDFFINGHPVIRGAYIPLKKTLVKKIKALYKKPKSQGNIFSYNRSQQNAIKILGLKKYIKQEHIPAPMRKTTFENFFTDNPKILENNIKYKFRHSKHIILQTLANHLEILNHSFHLKKSYQLIYLRNYKKPLLLLKIRLYIAQRNKKNIFLCMQSLSNASNKKMKYLKKILDKKCLVKDNETIARN